MMVSNFRGLLLDLTAICMSVIRQNNAENLKAYILPSCGNGSVLLYGITYRRWINRISTALVFFK